MVTSIRVTVPDDRGTYEAQLLEDGETVFITLEGCYVGQGYWEHGRLDVWDRLLPLDVRVRLDVALRAALTK